MGGTGHGHTGGVDTLYASTAIGALRRVEEYIQEAVVTVPRPRAHPGRTTVMLNCLRQCLGQAYTFLITHHRQPSLPSQSSVNRSFSPARLSWGRRPPGHFAGKMAVDEVGVPLLKR
jgi:hypothetical protein